MKKTIYEQSDCTAITPSRYPDVINLTTQENQGGVLRRFHHTGWCPKDRGTSRTHSMIRQMRLPDSVELVGAGIGGKQSL